jgi:predicted acyltransferase
MASPSEYRMRIGAFDILRGVTIALMIIVGNIGYNPYLTLLQHAEWNGLTIADLVMPFFIFTMGLIISYSLKKRST